MFSRKTTVKKGVFVENGNFYFSNGKKKEKICETNILQIPGKHNWENVGAAIAVAKILRIPNAVIAKTLADFTGLEHRLEFVAEKNGVRYYDDSYATTPETTVAAVKAFTAPKILILGGSSKESEFYESRENNFRIEKHKSDYRHRHRMAADKKTNPQSAYKIYRGMREYEAKLSAPPPRRRTQAMSFCSPPPAHHSACSKITATAAISSKPPSKS